MNAQLHIAGVTLTVVMHLGGAAAAGLWGRNIGDGDRARLADAPVVIEAALAIKAPNAPKRVQPQKQQNPKVAPPELQGVSRDADKAPVQPDKQDGKKPPPDFIDPSKTFDKFRDLDLDVDPTEGGEQDVEGSADGSEWGTEAQAKGHEYVGELRGRIEAVWNIPSLEQDTGVALGCVRLAPDGNIVARVLEQKSGIANLDRSVNEALRNASDMERPVPKELTYLTKAGICFAFSNK
jgi:hypothetical protein